MSACRWRSRSPEPACRWSASTSTRPGSRNCAPATTARREVESSDLHQPTLALRERCRGARGLATSSSSRCRRRSTRRAGRICARCSRASRTVGKALKPGDIVVYELTVYPGAVEEDCVPVLEQASGLKAGSDFTVGYSPERINPGDKEHRFETIIKVVVGAGCANARYRRRGLWLGGHGRHPPRAVDQGGGSRQGDREHAARSQHRVHERAVGDLRRARHRHRRRAGGGAHQVEFPALLRRAWSAATASASIRIT